MRNPRVLWITRTAVFLALLVVLQAVTSVFGNTLVTGSVVNAVLILSVMTCGLPSGLTVAVLSPVAAALVGIGPKLWTLIPFIALGNVVLVLLWHCIARRGGIPARVLALLAAAGAKFGVLYLGVVRVAIPLLLNLPEKQAAVISAMFSVSQLFTALIGGALAFALLPLLSKAIKARA